MFDIIYVLGLLVCCSRAVCGVRWDYLRVIGFEFPAGSCGFGVFGSCVCFVVWIFLDFGVFVVACWIVCVCVCVSGRCVLCLCLGGCEVLHLQPCGLWFAGGFGCLKFWFWSVVVCLQVIVGLLCGFWWGLTWFVLMVVCGVVFCCVADVVVARVVLVCCVG